jgi:hypothetical protein
VHEYVSCDALARIETGLLNELMGTTGRADIVGSSFVGGDHTRVVLESDDDAVLIDKERTLLFPLSL